MNYLKALIDDICFKTQFPLWLCFSYCFLFMMQFPIWFNLLIIPTMALVVLAKRHRQSFFLWGSVWCITLIFLISNYLFSYPIHIVWFLLVSVMVMLCKNSVRQIQKSLTFGLVFLIAFSLGLKLINLNFLSGDLVEYNLLTNPLFSWIDQLHSDDLSSIISANQTVVSHVLNSLEPLVIEGYANVKLIANLMTWSFLLMQLSMLLGSLFLASNRWRVTAFLLISAPCIFSVSIFPLFHLYFLMVSLSYRCLSFHDIK